jgi:hypothetical protein
MAETVRETKTMQVRSCTMAIIIAPAKCTQGVITGYHAEWLKLRCSCYTGKQKRE